MQYAIKTYGIFYLILPSWDIGIVLYIIPKDEIITDWFADTDNNGIYDVQEKYDQFVWRKDLIFPSYTLDDIRIKQFEKGRNHHSSGAIRSISAAGGKSFSEGSCFFANQEIPVRGRRTKKIQRSLLSDEDAPAGKSRAVVKGKTGRK